MSTSPLGSDPEPVSDEHAARPKADKAAIDAPSALSVLCTELSPYCRADREARIAKRADWLNFKG